MRDDALRSNVPAVDEGDRATPPLLPIGARIAAGEVRGARAADEFVLCTSEGQELTIAMAPRESATLEEDAARAIGDGATFPRALESGDHPLYGSYLVLTPPPSPARRVADVARTMSIAEALAFLERWLDAAARIEAAGFDWAPDAHDAWIDDSRALSLSRIRIASRLAPGERVDAQAILETVGALFVPEPAASGSPALVRALLPNASRNADVDASLAIDDAQRTLRAIADALSSHHALDVVAAASDVGLRRARNEDAYALASGEGWSVAVVCDGVAASSRADEASRVAAVAARDALARYADAGDADEASDRAAVRSAVRRANIAVCETEAPPGASEPPGTTIVAALVRGSRAVIGWVGDSRAYLVRDGGDALLTRDHSWANEARAYDVDGERSEVELANDPLAHALTRCLGLAETCDSTPTVADLVTADIAGGMLVLATDGLWNYFPDPRDLGALVRSAPTQRPTSIASWLAAYAVALGGQDNVTVSVLEAR